MQIAVVLNLDEDSCLNAIMLLRGEENQNQNTAATEQTLLDLNESSLSTLWQETKKGSKII